MSVHEAIANAVKEALSQGGIDLLRSTSLFPSAAKKKIEAAAQEYALKG